MKKLLITFLLLFSTISFSEEYNCSATWDGELRMSTFIRNGNHFLTDDLGRLEITNETNETLMMHLAFSDSIFIAIIDKVNKKFMENFVDLNDPLPAEPTIGNCF